MRTRNAYVGLLAVFAAIGCVLAGSAGARTLDYPLAVTVTGFSPSHAMAGQLVTVNGQNLTNTSGVVFGTTPVDSIAIDPDGTWVRVVVPSGVPTGPTQITLRVLGIDHTIGPFTVDSGSVPPVANPQPTAPTPNSGVSVKVVYPPHITAFAPTHGKVGTKVVIHGSNFGGTAWVTFGGVNAKFKVSSPTTIVAVVPKKAHTGKISVHTNSGGTIASFQAFKV